jgi:hypothetical protein
MIDITINATQISYSSSVIGLFSANYQQNEIDIVDDYSIHIPTDQGVILVNVGQFTFNGLAFTNSVDALALIISL